MSTRSKRKATAGKAAERKGSKRKALLEVKVERRRKEPAQVGLRQPEWCVCGNCVPEVAPSKRVCCDQAPAHCDAVSDAAEIHALLHLTNADIAAHPDLWTVTAPPVSVLVMTNPQKRIVCYRKLFRLRIGIGTQGHKVALPSCCRSAINTAYP
jgi:hypothetical protein